jgi:hypothetical protein
LVSRIVRVIVAVFSSTYMPQIGSFAEPSSPSVPLVASNGLAHNLQDMGPAHLSGVCAENDTVLH